MMMTVQIMTKCAKKYRNTKYLNENLICMKIRDNLYALDLDKLRHEIVYF